MTYESGGLDFRRSLEAYTSNLLLRYAPKIHWHDGSCKTQVEWKGARWWPKLNRKVIFDCISFLDRCLLKRRLVKFSVNILFDRILPFRYHLKPKKHDELFVRNKLPTNLPSIIANENDFILIVLSIPLMFNSLFINLLNVAHFLRNWFSFFN